MRKGLIWMLERGLGFVTVEAGIKKEVEKMRKGLSIIAGIAVLLFAYSASAGVVTSNLVSWWKFDETSGTNAPDDPTYGSGNTGTLYDFNAPACWTTNTAGSASSRALDFDGSNDYVNAGNGVSLNIADAITLEVWVNPDAGYGDEIYAYPRIFEKGNKLYNLHIRESSGQVYFGMMGGGVEYSLSTLTNTLPTGQWTMISATFDGTTHKIYYNGELVREKDNLYAGTIDTNVSAELLIGRRYSSAVGYFGGTIDEARIYSRALGPDEILGNYNAIPEPSTLLFLGAGLMSLLAFRRIRKRV